MTFLYNLGVLLGLIAALPRMIARKRLSIVWQRLTSKPPTFSTKEVIWIHAVSVGEIKSAKGLFAKIKQEYPTSSIVVTCATPSGLQEAKRSLQDASAICFMPFDFSWIMQKWASTLKPFLIVIVESDFWMQHLLQAKKLGAKIILVSGKLSEKSAARFAKCSFFSKKLFGLFDHLLVQNEEYYHRFLPLIKAPHKLEIGGNLKVASPCDLQQKTMKCLLSIAIISTHAPEEEELLAALELVPATLFFAPRHPERFDLVAKIFEKKHIPYERWSREKKGPFSKRVILIDTMGDLPSIYPLCDIAIVAGSFSSKVGGHNILEPCLHGLPVFFGPFMQNQKELREKVLQAGAGKQLRAEELVSELLSFRKDPTSLQSGVQKVLRGSGEALEKTSQVLFSLIREKTQKAWR